MILYYCFYITKFKYHLCYYLNLFAILAKGTVRLNFFKQNKLGLTLLTRYQPFWLSLFCEKIWVFRNLE